MTEVANGASLELPRSFSPSVALGGLATGAMPAAEAGVQPNNTPFPDGGELVVDGVTKEATIRNDGTLIKITQRIFGKSLLELKRPIEEYVTQCPAAGYILAHREEIGIDGHSYMTSTLPTLPTMNGFMDYLMQGLPSAKMHYYHTEDPGHTAGEEYMSSWTQGWHVASKGMKTHIHDTLIHGLTVAALWGEDFVAARSLYDYRHQIEDPEQRSVYESAMVGGVDVSMVSIRRHITDALFTDQYLDSDVNLLKGCLRTLELCSTEYCGGQYKLQKSLVEQAREVVADSTTPETASRRQVYYQAVFERFRDAQPWMPPDYPYPLIPGVAKQRLLLNKGILVTSRGL